MFCSCLFQSIAFSRRLVSSVWRLWNACGQFLPGSVCVTRAPGAPRLFARRLNSTEANCRGCFTCEGYPLLDIRSIYSIRDFSSGGVSSWRPAALCLVSAGRVHDATWWKLGASEKRLGFHPAPKRVHHCHLEARPYFPLTSCSAPVLSACFL